MTPSTEEAPADIGAVRALPTSALVVDQIRRALASGRYAVGDRLPAERELSKQLGVSRNTLREATRALAADGLLEVRRGASGGIRVAAATPRDAGDAALRAAAREITAILDLRIALESGGARFAATRRTADDLDRMQQAFDRMQRIFDEHRFEEVAEFWAADRDFHGAIGRAAHSEPLAIAIEDARLDFLKPLGMVFPTVDDHAHLGHDAILAAVVDGDPQAAAEAVRMHIEHTRAAVFRITGVDPAHGE